MVDFELSKPQKQIVEAARDFGKNILLPAETELDKIPDPQAVFTSDRFRAVIAQAFELGFSKMALPEKFGGMGLDPQTTGMVWEEIARW
ncbi:MAG: acyl-CoA dehydrogenase family protein, partial [Proteobacteria bacterium]|nr:acyl-CoA dehydrogenase family protein [Pseudomonadota bacterium]